MTSIYIVLVMYLLILLGIGVYYSKKNTNMTDYLLAGRNLKLFPAVLTLTATMFGGGMLTGFCQEAYLDGAAIFVYSIASLIGIAGVGLMAKKMAGFSNYTTVTEYLEARYNSPFLRTVLSFLSMVALVGILGSQVSAATGIFTVLGFKSSTISAMVAMALIIALTVLGGLWAVTMTDCFQIVLVIIGVIIITVVGLIENGGFSNILLQLNSNATNIPEGYTKIIGNSKLTPVLVAVVPMVMYELIGQEIYQRLFACKTERTARLTAYLTGAILFLLSFPPVIIGMIARLKFPELLENGTTTAAFASVAIEYLPGILVGVVLAAALSAILSTADSILTAATSHFMNDFWLRYIDKNADPDDKKMLRISRITSLILGIGAVSISFLVPQVLTLMVASYTLFTAGAFIPIVLGVFWQGATKQGAIAGVILGLLFAILGLSGFTIGTIPCEIFSACIAAVATVVVSLVTKK